MTTPAGAISLQDIITECGGSKPISLDTWYVQHVAKRWDGPISMSAMRGRTVHPAINEGAFGRTYVSYEFYVTMVGADTYWTRHPSNGHTTIYANGFQRWNALSSTASRGYVDVGGVRYYRGSLRETGPDWERYGLRWVE